MTKLAEYLEKNKVSMAALAKDIGVTRQHIWILAAGKVEPRVGLAVKIQKATNGAVSVESWGKGDKKLGE